MSGFDEWLSSDDFDIDAYSNRRSVFKAGAQSRQAEIDELKKKLAYQENAYKNVKLQFLNKGDDFNELQAMYEKQGLYAFELQKQIDEAVEVFEAHDLSHIDQIEKVYGILKGNQNEN